MGNVVVPVDDRLYSTLRIGSDDFPFMLFHDDLSNFARGFVNWHKQKEIEISFVLEGSVRVCLLNEEHLFQAGEGFIVLPGALHSIQPVGSGPNRYFTLIFDPCLITGYPGSFFEKTWYSPVVSAVKACHCILKNRDDTYGETVRGHLFYIYENAADGTCRTMLEIQRRLQEIWVLLVGHVFLKADCAGHKPEDARILAMLEYLRTHYAERFSLDAMAERHYISRGECCRYFKKMMGMTITEFLLDYRLSKAAQRLTLTRMSITSIAHAVGFHSASKFSEEFRKKTGQTPSAYRKGADRQSGQT